MKGGFYPPIRIFEVKMSCCDTKTGCTHQTGGNCGFPGLCYDNDRLPFLAPGVMGLSATPDQSVIDMDVQECAQAAKEKLYTDTNALQELYDQGVTDQQIWDALYTECEKQLNAKKNGDQAKPLIPEKINTYGAIGIAAGTLAVGMLVGYFIGKP